MIDEALGARLAAYSALTALVPSTVNGATEAQIYPDQVPQGRLPPWVTYTRVSTNNVYQLSGPAGLPTTRFEILCCAETKDEASDIAEAVRDCLDGYRGTVSSVFIQASILEGDAEENDIPYEGSQDRLWGVSLSYALTWEQSAPAL